MWPAPFAVRRRRASAGPLSMVLGCTLLTALVVSVRRTLRRIERQAAVLDLALARLQEGSFGGCLSGDRMLAAELARSPHVGADLLDDCELTEARRGR